MNKKSSENNSQQKSHTVVEKSHTVVEKRSNALETHFFQKNEKVTPLIVEEEKTEDREDQKPIPTPPHPLSVSSLLVTEAFRKKFPKISQEKATKYYNRYLCAIRRQVIKQRAFGNTGISIPFSTELALKSCRDFYHKGTRYYIWNEFQSIKPIIKVINKGSNMSGKVSQVKIDGKYLELLIATADAPELMSSWWGDDLDNFEFMPIDRVSLNYFIAECESNLASATGKYLDKIKNNLLDARQILVVSDWLVAHGITETACWPHRRTQSEYGRFYYRGVSIHTTSKELRRAALGDHLEYDVEASCYAVKLMIAKDIYEEQGLEWHGAFTYTKDYLDLKGPRRKQLAKHITSYPEPMKLVKEAITAVGFGARLYDSSWTDGDSRKYGALSSIIMNVHDRERFKRDPWVVEFCREQEELTQLIYQHYAAMPGIYDKLKDIKNMLTPSGKLKKTQVVCWVYQQAESMIMREVFKDMPIFATIHDCALSVGSLDMVEVRLRCQQISEYLHIEMDQHGRWYNSDLDIEVIDHKRHIAEEEARVARLLNKPVHVPRTVKHYKEYNQDGNSGAYYEAKSHDDSPFM